MRRMREALFISLLAIGLHGCQSAKSDLPTVGFAQFTSTTSLDELRDGFVRGLEEAGYEDGKHVKIVFQNAQSDAGTMGMIMQQFAGSTDIVALCSTQALQAAVKTIKKQPVVYCGVIDPVAAGAAESVTKPKPNVTGVYNPFPVTEGIKMVRRLMPEATKIGTLYDPSEPFFGQMHAEAEAACAKEGCEFVVVNITSSNDIVTGMQALKAKGVGALLQLPSNTVNQGINGQVKAGKDLKLPIFSLQPDQLEKGVVAAIGVDLADAGAQAGKMTARVLKGEKADGIPMEVAKLTDVQYNRDAGKAFGLKLP